MNSVITHECFCGSQWFKIYATFDDYEIGGYSLQMWCIECGEEFTTPTPLDKGKYLAKE